MSATQSHAYESAPSIEEVRGTFPSDAGLSDAVDRLAKAGFDRARMVLPSPALPAGAPHAVAAADNPKPEDDERQLRTLHSSTAATVAALAGAAAVVATGGAAAVAVMAAAGAGAVVGGGMFVANNASDAATAQTHDAAAARGQLLLVVAVTDAAERNLVENAMRTAGATDIIARRRADAEIGGQGGVI